MKKGLATLCVLVGLLSAPCVGKEQPIENIKWDLKQTDEETYFVCKITDPDGIVRIAGYMDGGIPYGKEILSETYDGNKVVNAKLDVIPRDHYYTVYWEDSKGNTCSSEIRLDL